MKLRLMKGMMGKRKHKPQRTCVGCHQVEDKNSLIRVVRTPDGVFVDPSGKRSGRGAYLHPRLSCWQQGLKSSLAHALRVELTDEDRQRMQSFMAERFEVEDLQE